ncbi:hypothetical protein ONS95_007440 [Cadophora gregata]|uniref:uncharacterized protein n=1 Tax=Cadophora gregata TaxID=51156 RepID=UPI0026DD6A2F|nr:uncharacterized protein ONS95_007440 [Cadophora gregata]KAK0118553.1 hypothetical protein ONS96_011646 [Cadophora gregata f. sp. sojae]KAK0125808.1 hypothetical protein ONS95_007440 [Cadophora gregata]
MPGGFIQTVRKIGKAYLYKPNHTLKIFPTELQHHRIGLNITMPSISASLEYLQKLELYKHEKPYWLYLTSRPDVEPSTQRVTNLEFEHHDGILVQDLRQLHTKPDINECGFQVISHQSTVAQFSSVADIQNYRTETEQLLRQALGAVYVQCYDSVLRKNITFERDRIDLADPLRIEGPGLGVHNGKFTLLS